MKKVIFSFAILAASAFAAMAQNNSQTATNCPVGNDCTPANVNCANVPCATPCTAPCPANADCVATCPQTPCAPRAYCKDGRRGGYNYMGCFDNLGLSTEQQTKIADLQKKIADRRQKDFDAVKKDAKKNNDKLTAEQKQKLRDDRLAKRNSVRKDYLNGIKSILTPDQYTKFLENNFMTKADRKDKGYRQGRKDGQPKYAHHGKNGRRHHGEKSGKRN